MHARAIVTTGLAKEVEAVNQYAPVILAYYTILCNDWEGAPDAQEELC